LNEVPGFFPGGEAAGVWIHLHAMRR